MRNHIPHLKTSALPWNSPKPGTSAKLLSLSEDRPSSTVLLCFDPDEGYEDQPSPHYHNGTEELLILDGQLSFDSKTWFHRGGYIFHPRQYIHGFKSRIPVRTTLFARTEGEFASNFIPSEDAIDSYPYFIGDTPASRPLSLVASPWAFPFEPIPSASGQIRQYIYSDDPETKTQTLIREYAAGSVELTPAPVPDGMAEEIFVLSGELIDATGQMFEEGDFACCPAGTTRHALTAVKQSEVIHSIFLD